MRCIFVGTAWNPSTKAELNMLLWEWRSALVSQLFSEILAYLLSWGLRPKWTVSGDKFNLFKLNLRLSWKSVTCILHAGLPCQSVNQMHVCLENNINGWLIKQQKCISPSSGSWKSEIGVPAWSVLGGPSSRLQTVIFSYPHMAEGARELSGVSLIWALILFMSASPSWPNHFLMPFLGG